MDELTPIDPADIRPGDVVELRYAPKRFTVKDRDEKWIHYNPEPNVVTFEPVERTEATWHLVSRPDPDAEAVEALATRLYANPADQEDREEAAKVLQALRDGGWDVVRRAES